MATSRKQQPKRSKASSASSTQGAKKANSPGRASPSKAKRTSGASKALAVGATVAAALALAAYVKHNPKASKAAADMWSTVVGKAHSTMGQWTGRAAAGTSPAMGPTLGMPSTAAIKAAAPSSLAKWIGGVTALLGGSAIAAAKYYKESQKTVEQKYKEAEAPNRIERLKRTKHMRSTLTEIKNKLSPVNKSNFSYPDLIRRMHANGLGRAAAAAAPV